MLPVNCGSHADYQHFVVTNFRKYYPDPDALARSTWDIIERFWNLDLSFTDTFMADKYSLIGEDIGAGLPALLLCKLCFHAVRGHNLKSYFAPTNTSPDMPS